MSSVQVHAARDTRLLLLLACENHKQNAGINTVYHERALIFKKNNSWQRLT